VAQVGVVSGKGALQIPPLRSPGFPVESRGSEEVHAALSAERRTRCRRWQRVVGNPVRSVEKHSTGGELKTVGAPYLEMWER
jgi:hypothetical protein